MQEPNFSHDSFKNLSKLRQVCQGAVGLCQKIVTLKGNDCASFYVVTVIQIMCMTQGTALLEQSSLSFHCHMNFYFTISSYVSLWHNCSRSLKFNICCPDRKMCIHIENGLFSIF